MVQICERIFIRTRGSKSIIIPIEAGGAPLDPKNSGKCKRHPPRRPYPLDRPNNQTPSPFGDYWSRRFPCYIEESRYGNSKAKSPPRRGTREARQAHPTDLADMDADELVDAIDDLE